MALLKLKIPFGSPCLDHPTADKYLQLSSGIGAIHMRRIRSYVHCLLTGGRDSG
jgi:hypothetical protein